MKYLAHGVILMALIPAYAQNSTNTISPSPAQLSSDSGPSFVAENQNGRTARELLISYAANLDGLLREFTGQMEAISELVESGELSPLAALALKLETARAVIARLETISAVLDSLILPSDENPGGSIVPQDDGSAGTTVRILRARHTISVRELRRENSQ